MSNFWYSQHNPQIKLSQKEILNISEAINREFPLKNSSTQPELVILPVDPYHLYIYWNLGSNLNNYWNVGKNSNNATSKDELETQLTLRIYSHPSDNTSDSEKTKIWFDVPIYGSQTQQQVRLPSYETAYSAAIGKRYPDNKFVIFASSDIINVPLGRMSPYQPGIVRKEPIETAQTDLLEKQTSDNKTSYQSSDSTAEKAVQTENSADENYKSRSSNPEFEKGIEVSLMSNNKMVAPTVPDKHVVKHYDETLIGSITKKNLSNQDNKIVPTRKILNSDNLHLVSKNKSGKGFN